MLRTERRIIDPFEGKPSRVVGTKYDLDHDPARAAPDVHRAVRSYDAGQYSILWNAPKARWQIVALFKGQVHLVRTWQDDEGGYLPLSMQIHDWLIRTSFDHNFGTRKPREVDRALRNRELAAEEKRESQIQSDLQYVRRDDRHVLNKIHAKWQKFGYPESWLAPARLR